MNAPMLAALLLAFVLLLLGLGSGSGQVRAWLRLADRRHVPSDERRFLRRRYRLRFVTALVLLVLGGMLAGAYLSGMERRADALAMPRANTEAGVEAAAGAGERPPLNDADKAFLRFWGLYWVAAVSLVFVLIGLACADAWSTRRYLATQLQALRDEHNTKLRRDLAVLRSRRHAERSWRRGDPTPPPAPEPEPDG